MPGPATDRILYERPDLQNVRIPERVKTLCRWMRDLGAPRRPAPSNPPEPPRPSKLRVVRKPRKKPPTPSTQSKLPLNDS